MSDLNCYRLREIAAGVQPHLGHSFTFSNGDLLCYYAGFNLSEFAKQVLATRSDTGRVPDRELFWLIERIGHGQYVQDRSTRPGLTSDAWRAARFDTEKDAHDFWLRLITLRDECKPVEHMFVNKPGGAE